MSICNCFSSTESGELKKNEKQSHKASKEVHALAGRRSLNKSKRRLGESGLPTLAEHPEDDPNDEQLDGTEMDAVIRQNGKEDTRMRQRLSDANIMASYDSVFLDTDTGSIAGSMAGSIRSSIAPSTTSMQDTEDYDSFGTPLWTIDPHDIFFVARNDSDSKVCRIGRGEHGPVYLGVWQEQDVAVKLSKQRPTSFRAERQFHRKVGQLHGISHPNIVKFYGACFWKGGKRCVALTEFMEKGSLTSILEKRQSESERQAVDAIAIALNVAKGLAHLHDIGVVHGRVKASNILFSETSTAKIAVPCLSTLLNHIKSHTSRARLQNLEVMPVAPEVKFGASKSMEADIYCFGIVVWRLLTNSPDHSNLRPIRSPEEACPKIAWLIDSCLDPDPESRPSARMIVSILKKFMK